MSYLEDPHLFEAFLSDLDVQSLGNMAQTEKRTLEILSRPKFWSRYFEKHGLLLLDIEMEPTAENFFQEFFICQFVLKNVDIAIAKLRGEWMNQWGNMLPHETGFFMSLNILKTVPLLNTLELRNFLHKTQYQYTINLAAASGFVIGSTIRYLSETNSYKLRVSQVSGTHPAFESIFSEDDIRDILYRLHRLDHHIEIYDLN